MKTKHRFPGCKNLYSLKKEWNVHCYIIRHKKPTTWKKHTMSRGQDLRTNQPTQGTYKAKHFHVFYYTHVCAGYAVCIVFLKILY